MSRLLLSLIVATHMLLSATVGCSRIERLPQAAHEAVIDQAKADYAGWLAPPVSFDQLQEISIRRAWRAKNPPTEYSLTDDNPTMWCVELVVSGQQMGSKVEASEIWVATTQGSDDPPQWMAAALRTFSSLSPYERCGQNP